MNPPDDKIWVALHQGTAFVRVLGRASFKISSALKQFGSIAMASGCTTMLFDMAECVGMDSTFMGVLGGLAVRLKREAGGVVVLANLTPRTRGLVATLGLDNIVRAYEPGALPEGFSARLAESRNMKVLDSAPESRLETAAAMLEAHEQLVALAPENLPRFKDVLSFLREDLKKAEAAAKTSGRPNDPA